MGKNKPKNTNNTPPAAAQNQPPRNKNRRPRFRPKHPEQPEKKSLFGKLVTWIKTTIVAEPKNTQRPNKNQPPQQQPRNANQPANNAPRNAKKNKAQKNAAAPERTPSESDNQKVSPIIQAMMSRRTHNTIVVNSDALETRVAYLSDGRLEDYQIERANARSINNAIYLGRICNLEPTLEAAFVDIGEEKNAFLHYRDMTPVTFDVGERVTRSESLHGVNKAEYNTAISRRIQKIMELRKAADNEGAKNAQKRRSGKFNVAEIPQLFPASSPVLVQVSKDPIGTKGARVTTNISIPGRYLVLLPYSEHIGISKKITDRAERNRLRDILSTFELPPGVGLICRTNGEGHKKEHFENDISMLLDIWDKIERALLHPRPPQLLYAEPDIIERTLRDSLTEDIDEVYIDNKEVYDKLRSRLDTLRDDGLLMHNFKLELHTKKEPIFATHAIDRQIEGIFSEQSRLPSGGYIIIEETEALVAVDVNTGHVKKGKDMPETLFDTNVEAAQELMRQIRLRALGGLIVVDFIDLPYEKQRNELYQIMRYLAQKDHVKTEVSPISRFGLMEMTRQREQRSLMSTVYHNCPYCKGLGRVRSVNSMAVDIHRSLRETLQRLGRRRPESIRVFMRPEVLEQVRREDSTVIENMESEFDIKLSFRPDEQLHREEYKLVDTETEQVILFNGGLHDHTDA